MQSIASVYKIGHGPSSSHTMGPVFAVQAFKKAHPKIKHVKIILYGSLALTGKGHLTDAMMIEAFEPVKATVIFNHKLTQLPHPNTLDIMGLVHDKVITKMRVISIGGGEIQIVGKKDQGDINHSVYPISNLNEIISKCETKKIGLINYIKHYEPASTWKHLSKVWISMQLAIREGLQRSGNLPGKLNYPRKAKKVHSIDIDSRYSQSRFIRSDNKLMSFAYACSEQNASGGVIVTAPTCGACGVLPSILLKAKHDLHIADKKIVEALAIAGLVGNITRTNASIAGAEAGCQAEIGVACAMAAAAYTYILDQPDRKIMNAATNALEHHLGLTCDPVLGYVQVPCIERNVFAASRAVTATHLAMLNDENQMWTYDEMIAVMLQTGKDLKRNYRETSIGGLAKAYLKKNK